MSDRYIVRRDINGPPGGWKYTVPETGVTLTGQFFKTLYPQVRAHMEANSLPLPSNLEAIVMDGACRETNPGGSWCCKAPEKPHAGALPHLTLAKAETFVRSIMGALKNREFVSREEAERRHAICMDCPLATSIGGCLGCHGILRMVEKLMKSNPLPDDPEKRFCSACGCYIRIKAFLPNQILDDAEKVKPAYHEKCWRYDAPEVES